MAKNTDIAARLAKDAGRIEQFLKRAPRAVGQLAVREFVGNFRRQSFQDEGGAEHAWPSRKVRRYRRKSGKGKSSRLVLTKAGRGDRGRALLVQSGQLRRSITVGSLDNDSVTITTDSEYAEAHNEGHRYNNRTLPQRQFMGASRRLNADVITYLKSGVDEIMRPSQNRNQSY